MLYIVIHYMQFNISFHLNNLDIGEYCGNSLKLFPVQKVVCNSEYYMNGPDNCPTKTKAELLEKALKEYNKPEIREFALRASIQELENYINLPEGLMSRSPRVEEIIQFAKKMGYR